MGITPPCPASTKAKELMTLLQDGARVAIVDDVERDAETTSFVLADAGLDPQAVELLDDPSALVDSLLGRYDGVVCDHRLQSKVRYYGAQVVAECMRRGLPAVLLTTFADPRDNAVIQTYRARIPELLMRGSEATGIALRNALDHAAAETTGTYRRSRRPYRTVVRVAERHDDHPPTIELSIPAWSTSQVVSVPMSSFAEFAGSARVGQRFLADVNIYSQSHLDLYAANFEPIPDATFEELIESTDER